MNLYIDESGSINNHAKGRAFFTIGIVYVKEARTLKSAFKRFVSSRFEKLKALDTPKIVNGIEVRPGNKMFCENGSFRELKGSQFDKAMKKDFIDYFSKKPSFEVFYIVLDNHGLSDTFCHSTSRGFNYVLRLALSRFISHGYLPKEVCHMVLDERNERVESRFFLQDYLNTELVLGGVTNAPFDVHYTDSSKVAFVQMADVFSNLMYSNLMNHSYDSEIESLRKCGIIKDVFYFPINSFKEIS